MSILESLQQECADRLSALPAFANIPVLVEHLRSYQSDYERALGPGQVVGGKTGACVTIRTPTAHAHWPEVNGPFFDEIPIVAHVQENREVNQNPACGTLVSALGICETIAAGWCQFFPTGANGPLMPQKPTIIRGANDEFVNYTVCFRTMGGIRDPLPQAAAPTSGLSGGRITLACATVGAAIFYTQDGTNPGPRNGTLYTAPFAPTGPVRARAWLAGYLASDLLTV